MKKIKNKFLIIGSIVLILVAIFCVTNRFNRIGKIKKSVLLISVYDKNEELIATGSGVVTFSNDTIITNAHVVEDNYRIEVISEDNTKYEVAGIIAYNKSKDIAILKLNNHKGLKNVKTTTKIEVGDDVIAIGSPLGLKNTVSKGNLSGYYQDSIEVYQHTAPISHGSSGGGLFSKNGKLIGITYASIEGGQNINLAIPIKYYETIYNESKNNSLIDTSMYKYLSNPILKTQYGSQLLAFALNDRYGNSKFESGNNKGDNEGNLEICNSLKNCIFSNSGNYNKIEKQIKGSLYLSSGNGNNYGINEHGEAYLIEKAKGYKLIVLKKNKNSNVEELQNYIRTEFNADRKDIFNTQNYVYYFSCENYEKCNTVEEMVKKITK